MRSTTMTETRTTLLNTSELEQQTPGQLKTSKK